MSVRVRGGTCEEDETVGEVEWLAFSEVATGIASGNGMGCR